MNNATAILIRLFHRLLSGHLTTFCFFRRLARTFLVILTGTMKNSIKTKICTKFSSICKISDLLCVFILYLKAYGKDDRENTFQLVCTDLST